LTEFTGVGSAAYGFEAIAITAHAQLDQFDGRRRDVESEHRSLLIAEYHLIFLPRLGLRRKDGAAC
jgi:hypothetical protein